MPPPAGSLEAFTEAQVGSVIRNCEVEQIKQALRLVMVKVGLRAQNFPLEQEKTILLTHVVKEYGSHTPAEIVLAFDLAITGKLDIPAKEVVCYENFSCLYFSHVMNAYRRWGSEQRKLIRELPAAGQDPAPLNEQEMETWWKEIAEKIRRGTYGADLIPLQIFTWKKRQVADLTDPGITEIYLIRAIFHQMGVLTRAARNELTPASHRSLREFEEYMDKGEFPAPVGEQLRNMARKLWMFDLMTKKNDNDGKNAAGKKI